MMITEPMTMLTDYMLFGQSLIYAYLLSKGSLKGRVTPRQIWSWAFSFIALGSLLGGTYHGLALILDSQETLLLRRLTAYSIGLTSLLMVWGASWLVMGASWRRKLLLLLVGKLVIFVTWVTIDIKFLWVILDYAPAVITVAVFELIANRRQDQSESNTSYYFTYGLGAAVLGAIIQQSGFSLHENFNHNDLYHIIQMIGLHGFFLGARNLLNGPPEVESNHLLKATDF